jgi:hypothetical protein
MPRAQPITDKLRFDLRIAFGLRIPAHCEAQDSRRQQYQLSHNFFVPSVCVFGKGLLDFRLVCGP